MARTRLNEKQKDRVVELHDAGVAQNQIATFFGVSSRTVDRALQERGVKPATGEAREIVEIVRRFNLTSETLSQALSAPALTPENIRHALSTMSPSQLGTFFYSVVAQRVQLDMLRAQQQQQAAAPTQEALPV